MPPLRWHYFFSSILISFIIHSYQPKLYKMSTEVKVIKGETVESMWQQVRSDFEGEDLLGYHVLLDNGNHVVELDVDIDLGGGFEGGYEITRFISRLPGTNDFKFALHKEDFLDEIGKFFGMQDVKLCYEDFDKHVVVKTNDEARTKQLLSDETLRLFIVAFEDDFTLSLSKDHEEKVLAFEIEKGITDVAVLQKIYSQYVALLTALNKPLAGHL